MGNAWDGARCGECPLRNSVTNEVDRTHVVPPKRAPYSRLAIVADQPGSTEVATKSPLTGYLGNTVRNIAKSVNVKLGALHLTNAVLCYPYRKLTAEQEKKAVECCRPRLARELKSKTKVVTIGKKAFQSLCDTVQLDDWQGAIKQGSGDFSRLQVMPTKWPVKVGQFQLWATFLERIIDPEDFEWGFHYDDKKDSIDICLQVLKQIWRDQSEGASVAIDIETAGTDPLTAPLICIGISSGERTVSLRLETLQKYNELDRWFRLILHEGRLIGHNGVHDLLGLEANGYTVSRHEYFDTLVAHAVLHPDIRHGLGNVASQYYNCDKWKKAFKVSAASDAKGLEVFTNRPIEELLAYNSKDADMTAKLKPALLAESTNDSLMQSALDVYLVGGEMTRFGLAIDETARSRHERELTATMERCRAEFDRLVGGKAQLGASGAHQSLKALFFETYGLTPLRFSEKNNGPTLDAQTLKSYSAQNLGLRSKVAATVLEYRKASKLMSTYVGTFTGRLHPNWKSWGTISGRWASSGPNCQNVPVSMRDMIVSRWEGGKIIGCDYDQLELRVIALLANDEPLLRTFLSGADPHTENCKLMFNHDPGDNKKDPQRVLAKTAAFAFNYSYYDSVEAAHQKIAETFPGVNQAFVRDLRKKWFAAHPAIREWQVKTAHNAQVDLYVEEALSGRRRYWQRDRVDINEVLNFPVQAFAGTLMNRAILKLRDALGPDSRQWEENGAGIIAQVHDAAYLDVRADFDKYAEILENCMTQTIELDGRRMEFTAKADAADNWKEA